AGGGRVRRSGRTADRGARRRAALPLVGEGRREIARRPTPCGSGEHLPCLRGPRQGLDGRVRRRGHVADASRVAVAPLELQDVLAAADRLVVLVSRRAAERRAERPGALVAVLVATAVVPRRPERIGDRLV